MEFSTKLELTHDGAYPKERTLVGAKMSVRVDLSDNSSAGKREYSDIYYVLIDAGKKVSDYQLSLEYHAANRIEKNLPPGSEMKILRFSNRITSMASDTQVGRFAHEKVKKKRSRMFAPLQRITDDLSFKQLRTTLIVLSNGRVSDRRKVKRAVRRGDISLSDNCRTFVLGVGKRKDSRFLSFLASRLRGTFYSIENVADLLKSLREVGMPEQPVAADQNGKVLILADSGVNERNRELTNGVIRSIWDRLPEDREVAVVGMEKNPVVYFNGSRGYNAPPTIERKGGSNEGLYKAISNEFRKEDDIESMFIISDGRPGGVRKAARSALKSRLGLPFELKTVVVRIGRNGDRKPSMMKLANALGGMIYDVKEESDIDALMHFKPVNFEGGLSLHFSDRFRIAKMNDVYFPLYGDKNIRLSETDQTGSKQYVIYALMDIPPDDVPYHGTVDVSYNRNPTSSATRKIEVTLPRSYIAKMDEALASEMDYDDLSRRLSIERSFDSDLGAVAGRETSAIVDRYMEEHGLQLFERKMARTVTEKLASHNPLLTIIKGRDIQKAIKSIVKGDYFGSRVIIFSSNEHYRSVTLQGRNRDVFAFTISQELLEGIRPHDLRDISRAANILVTEIVSFMGNVSTGAANLAVIYDFHELAAKIARNGANSTMLRMFVDALVEAFEPWNMKVLFLSSGSSRGIGELSESIPTVNLAFEGTGERLADPLTTVREILDKAGVGYSEGHRWLRVGSSMITDNEDLESDDAYLVSGDEIQRVVNRLRINFSIVDGMREFLLYALDPENPIAWTQQLAAQMKIPFTSTTDTIIVNDTRITRGKPDGFRKNPGMIYVDEDWNALRTVEGGVEVENARLLISEIMRQETSQPTINDGGRM